MALVDRIGNNIDPKLRDLLEPGNIIRIQVSKLSTFNSDPEAPFYSVYLRITEQINFSHFRGQVEDPYISDKFLVRNEEFYLFNASSLGGNETLTISNQHK